MRALLLILVVLVLAAGGPSRPVDAQAPVVMKVATVNPGESPRNIAAYEFARVLGEKSKGRIKVDVYINNQLARGEGAMLEGVQLGTIDVAPVGSAPIGGIFEPAYLPLDLPFLWASREQVWKVVDGPIGQELFKKMEAKGRGAQVAEELLRSLQAPSRELQRSTFNSFAALGTRTVSETRDRRVLFR